MIPVLSKDCTFDIELELVHTRGHMMYGVILGQDTMRKLKIGTIISKNIFTWKEISRPVVAGDHWSMERIKSMEPV